jgi:uncharacterized protein (TIGR03435 family)
MLTTPWLDTIVAVCFGGIAYCLSCWGISKKILGRLVATVAILMVIRIFFLQPYRAATDAAAPEIPRGSHFLVWKLADHFAPGDLIAYQHDGWASLGRVVRSEGGVVSVNRNGKADAVVSPDAILGKVISVYWRASMVASPTSSLRPSEGTQPGFFRNSDNGTEARAVSLGALMAYAYGPSTTYFHWSGNRVLLPPGVADGKFDFLLAAPDQPQETLQAEIKKQLGLVAHRELRDADVLILEVSNPSRLGLEEAKGGNSSDSRPAPGRFEFTNEPIGDLGDFLEIALGKPVINETGLDQKYSGRLQWNPQSSPAAEVKEIQNALSDQLGLELDSSHQSIEMLVVEKTP